MPKTPVERDMFRFSANKTFIGFGKRSDVYLQVVLSCARLSRMINLFLFRFPKEFYFPERPVVATYSTGGLH